MALFTKLFTKDLDPYKLKGRYYKLNIDSSMNVTGDTDIFSDCHVYNRQFLYLKPKRGVITDVVACGTNNSNTYAVNCGHVPTLITNSGKYRASLSVNTTDLVDAVVFVQVVDL